MSDRTTIFTRDVTQCDDMEDWVCMLNSIVNFLSAASALATKLEQNYLLSSITYLRRPAFPLLCPPPQIEDNQEKLNGRGIHAKNDETNGPIPDICPLSIEEVPTSHPESEYQCEPSGLPRDMVLINTQEKGDSTNIIDSPEEHNEYDFNQTEEDQQNDVIKICGSEDTIYFENFINPEKPIVSINLEKPSDQISNGIFKFSIVDKGEAPGCSTSFVEDKSVQAKRTNIAGSSKNSKHKVKSIKSEEIQTHPTNRYKDTVRALITKSPELQKPIRDSIVNLNPGTDDGTREDVISPKGKLSCKHSAVPKNLNELKEQLNSIKNICNSRKNEDRADKGILQTSCRTTADKRINKNEKQSTGCPNANTYSNVPLKSPGTSKRFASIESVVKKLIHSTKAIEKKTEEAKGNQKTCIYLQRKVKKQSVLQEKSEESKKIAKSISECIEKKESPPKDFKYVRNHQDHVCKRTAAHKLENIKVIQNRPSSTK